jgi:hypothetical protein
VPSQLRLRNMIVLLAGSLALIGTAGAATAQDALDPAAAPDAALTVAQTPTALALELSAVLQDEAARLRELEASFGAAADASSALAVEREIAAVKSVTEIRLMRVQARHAREAGRLEAAVRIEAAIAELTTASARPATPPPITPRAEPRDDGQRREGGPR